MQGSAEAIQATVLKLAHEEVKVRVLLAAVGQITESDVQLAKASEAVIVAFNVRATAQARELAQRDGVDIRYYSIIYEVADDIEKLVRGKVAPKAREKFLGYAEIRKVFDITKTGKVAGCMVTEGLVKRGCGVRLLRDGVVIHQGELSPAQALQGRRARGGARLRVRPVLRRLQRPARRRHGRVLRDGDGSGVSRRAQAARRPSQRQLRVAEEIRHVLAGVFARGEFRDPDLAGGADHGDRGADQPGPQARDGVRGAARPLRCRRAAAGPCARGAFLRGQVARQLRLRYAPELHFQPDTALDYAMQIEALLHSPDVARDLG